MRRSIHLILALSFLLAVSSGEAQITSPPLADFSSTLENTSLRGVQIKAVLEGNGTYRFFISDVKAGTPASAAGIRAGDRVIALILGGQNHNEQPSASMPVRVGEAAALKAFYSVAASCSPDCLLQIDRGHKDGTTHLVNIPVGCLGTNFVRRYDEQAEEYVYIDTLNGQSISDFVIPKLVLPKTGSHALRGNESTSSTASIQTEIARIRDGQHVNLPAAQAAETVAGNETGVTISNRTAETLYVYFSGPSIQQIQISAGGKQTVSLQPGDYEVAAKVSSPNVNPFYGKQTYGSHTRYSEQFYLITKP
jgi:hypothetical protein